MIALFSPSEGKRPGGAGVFKDVSDQLIAGETQISVLIREYERVLRNGVLAERQSLTGWKDEQKISKLPTDLSTAPVLPAVQRYSGVGYQYLDEATLSATERSFLAEHVIIFSNLLGPLRADDLIPETKLKQRNTFAGVKIANYYRERTTGDLGQMIDGQLVLDLRAEFYKSFYIPEDNRVECIFQKNGKKINHWSKAYRGLLLRCFVKEQPETVKEFLQMEIPGLKRLKDVHENNCTTITYEIISETE